LVFVSIIQASKYGHKPKSFDITLMGETITTTTKYKKYVVEIILSKLQEFMRINHNRKR